jgi:3-phenylpropionate/cinnamic acid dioxygenase small subunit
VSDHDAIRDTIARYCQLCDDGRFEEWGELYTEDAAFHVMGNVYKGREEVKGFIRAGQPPELRGKHVAVNTVIDLKGDEADSTTDFIFIARVGDGLGVTQAGRYHDRLVRAGQRWLFAERRIVFMGDEPPGEG